MRLEAFKPSIYDHNYSIKERMRNAPFLIYSLGRYGDKLFKGFIQNTLVLENLSESDKSKARGTPILISWGRGVSYMLDSTPDIPEGLVGFQVMIGDLWLKGVFRENEYLEAEKSYEMRGMPVIRTQLTVLNLVMALQKNSNLPLDETVCFYNLGSLICFNIGKQWVRSILISSDPISGAITDVDKLESFFRSNNMGLKVHYWADSNCFIESIKKSRNLSNIVFTPLEFIDLNPIHPELEAITL